MLTDFTRDANGNTLEYKGNTSLRSANVPLSYTQEHLDEFKKCSEDIIYFIETYCYINDPDEGLIIPKLYPWQKELLLAIKDNRKIVIMIPRQSGKSTTLSMFMTWFSLFNNDKTSAIVAQKEMIAKEVFKRVNLSIARCPQFLKPGVVEWNKTSLEFDNGSRIICAATTPDGISGYTINGILLMDEIAKVKPTIFEEFFTAMEPTVSAADGSKLVGVSTPVGMNHFYRMWRAAEKGLNGFKTFQVGWQSTPKRDEAWKIQKIKEVGLDNFNQEYACDFLGSTESLLKTDVLKALDFKNPVRKDMNGEYQVFVEAIPQHRYVAIVDTAEGLGEDYSVINVIDVTPGQSDKNQLEQVAMFRSNLVDQTVLAHIAGRIGKQYNEAMMVVESNFGSETSIQLLNEVEYPNLYMTEKGAGISMNKRIKRIGVERLREMINNNLLKINAIELLEEFANFVRQKDSWGADRGYHDDIVATLVLFAYFTRDDWYKEFASADAYKEMHREKIKQLADVDMPMPMLSVDDDGTIHSTHDPIDYGTPIQKNGRTPGFY